MERRRRVAPARPVAVLGIALILSLCSGLASGAEIRRGRMTTVEAIFEVRVASGSGPTRALAYPPTASELLLLFLAGRRLGTCWSWHSAYESLSPVSVASLLTLLRACLPWRRGLARTNVTAAWPNDDDK